MKQKLCSLLLAAGLTVSAAQIAGAWQPTWLSTTVWSKTASQEQTSAATTSVHTYERQVVTLVNRERAARGLSALTMDSVLCRYARIKAKDLHDGGYFSHTSPTYGSPFQMMKSFGISYAHAGENIAMGYFTPETVVAAWMNSASHRENILSPNYTRLGVGYVADGGYWTQWFLGN